MNGLNTKKVSRQAQLLKILSGISVRLPGVTSITLGGKTVVLTDFVKQIQTELDDIAATAKAKAAYASQVQTERTVRASLAPTLRQFRSYVVATFGDTQDSVKVLEAFGYFPRKQRKPPAKDVVQANEKRAATKAKEKAGTPAPQPAPVTKA